MNNIFTLVSSLLLLPRLKRSMKYIMVFFLYASIANLSIVTSTLADKTGKSQTLQTIPVELTTTVGHQQSFVEGEEIQFLLSLGDDAYVYMYHIDAAGKIYQILPSAQQNSHFYKQGFFLTIPNYEKLFRFIVSQPYGDATIYLFASDQSVLDINIDSTSISEIREHIISRSVAFGEDKFSFSSRSGASAQSKKEKGSR